MATKLPRFLTLGPPGTNHEFATRRYLAFHEKSDAPLSLIENFTQGLAAVAEGRADFLVQAAAHPEATDTIARARYRYDVHVVDTFICPTKRLGVLTRADIDEPQSIGFQPATEAYADLSAWPRREKMASTVAVGDALMSGAIDSGLTFLDLAEDSPETFRIDVDLGVVHDPWIVYGRIDCSDGELIACADSPVGKFVHSLSK